MYVCVYIYVCISIYVYISHLPNQSSIDGHLGYFQVLAIVNNAAMNSGVHVSFQIRIFVFSSCMPKSGIAESYGSSNFCTLREPHSFP